MAYEKKLVSTPQSSPNQAIAGFDSGDEHDEVDKHTSYDAKSSNDGHAFIGSPSPKESDILINKSAGSKSPRRKKPRRHHDSTKTLATPTHDRLEDI